MTQDVSCAFPNGEDLGIPKVRRVPGVLDVSLAPETLETLRHDCHGLLGCVQLDQRRQDAKQEVRSLQITTFPCSRLNNPKMACCFKDDGGSRARPNFHV